jgi:hypothetical protein
MGLGGLVIIMASVVYPAVLRPQPAAEAVEQAPDPNQQRQKLLLTLARLDEAYEAGELDEQIYQQARRRYKQELAALLDHKNV